MYTTECKFTQALRLIDTKGWTKEELENSQGAYCLMGALGNAHDVIGWLQDEGLGIMWESVSDAKTRLKLQGYEKNIKTLVTVIKEQFRDRLGFEQVKVNAEGDIISVTVTPWDDFDVEETDDFTIIATFNDCQLTTVDDVKLVLEKARALEDAS